METTPPIRPPAQRGFTLVELMVALAILAVLITIALPSMWSMFERTQLTATVNDFLSQMHRARSEAIKRRSRVVLCKSGDGFSCMATGGWEQGWIVFQDVNNNGVRDPAEQLLHAGAALPAGWYFSGNQAVARYISYAPSGGSRLVSGAFQAGTLTLCHRSEDTAEARQLVINAVGRPRILRTQVPSCN